MGIYTKSEIRYNLLGIRVLHTILILTLVVQNVIAQLKCTILHIRRKNTAYFLVFISKQILALFTTASCGHYCNCIRVSCVSIPKRCSKRILRILILRHLLICKTDTFAYTHCTHNVWYCTCYK